MNQPRKVASRFLIPLEMYLGVQAIAWGLSGSICKGGLHNVLAQDDQSLSWGVILCSVGAAQIVLGVIEWLRGKRWDLLQIHRSVSYRAVASLVAAFAWVAAGGVLFIAAGFTAVPALTLSAPFSIAFCMWCYKENLQVRYALDQQYKTSTIQFCR
jgi:hypothetical protein